MHPLIRDGGLSLTRYRSLRFFDKKLSDKTSIPNGMHVVMQTGARTTLVRSAPLAGRPLALPADGHRQPEALDTALGLAERIRKAVAEAPPQACTVSIGATDWRGAQDNLDGMLARADEALYRAKQAGRNRVEAAP